MIRFLLEDSTTKKQYSINLNFKSEEDFYDFIDEDDDFELFMDKMECDEHEWCGVHDFIGTEEYVGYVSYEIRNYELAIKKWAEFFKEKNLLIE